MSKNSLYLSKIILFLLVIFALLPFAESTGPKLNTLIVNPTNVDAGEVVTVKASVSSSDSKLIFGCVNLNTLVLEDKSSVAKFFCEHELDYVQDSNNLICKGKAPFREGEITLGCMARNLYDGYSDFKEVKFTVNPLSAGNNPPVWNELSVKEGYSFNGGDVVTIVANGAYDRDGDGLYFGCTRSLPGSDNSFMESAYNSDFKMDLVKDTWGDPNFNRWSLEPEEFFENPLEPIPTITTEYEFFCEDHEPNDPQYLGEIVCQGRAPFTATSSEIKLTCALHDGVLHAEPFIREISFNVMPKALIAPNWYGEFEFLPRKEAYSSGEPLDIKVNGVSDVDDERAYFQCVNEYGNYICKHNIKEPQYTNDIKCQIEIPYQISASQYQVKCSIHDGANHAVYNGNEIFEINIPLLKGTSQGGTAEKSEDKVKKETPSETAENRVSCSRENTIGTICDSSGYQQPAVFSKAQCKGTAARITTPNGEGVGNPVFDPRIPMTCNEKKSTCTEDRTGVIMYSFDDCCQKEITVQCPEGIRCIYNQGGIGICKSELNNEDLIIVLAPGEYLVPIDILKALYVVTMNSEWDSPFNDNPRGIYISKNFIPTSRFDIFPGVSSKGEQFKNLLREKTDFSEEDIDDFYKLASTIGNLLLSREDYNKDVHFHERLHKIIDENLNEDERTTLTNSKTNFILWMDDTIVDENEYGEILFYQKYMANFLHSAISRGSWSEMYAYFGQLEKFPSTNSDYKIDKKVYEEFEKQYPEAFIIYKNVVEQAFAIGGFYEQQIDNEQQIDKVIFSPGTEFIKEEVKKMDIYSDLQNMPYQITIEIDNTVYEREHTGEMINEAGPYGNPKIKVRIVSQDFLPNLNEIDRDYFYPTVYHELVHAYQEQILDDYFKNNNLLNTPEWKMKFYFANIPKENQLHIGSELDAAYKEMIYTKSIEKPISKAQISFYMIFLLRIIQTDNYKNYPEIRSLVKSYDEKVWEMAKEVYKEVLDKYNMAYPIFTVDSFKPSLQQCTPDPNHIVVFKGDSYRNECIENEHKISAADVSSKSKEAYKNRENLREEAAGKLGIKSMSIFEFLNEEREHILINALIETSKKAGIEVEILTAVAFQENIGEWVDISQRYGTGDLSRKSVVVPNELALDYFFAEADTLKREGFLRDDFEKFVSTDGARGSFDSIDSALEALAATLLYRRSLFFEDLKELGIDKNILTKDQIAYWTYIYFNCGASCGGNRIKRYGIEIPKSISSSSTSNPDRNAKLFLGIIYQIRSAGLFDSLNKIKVYYCENDELKFSIIDDKENLCISNTLLDSLPLKWQPFKNSFGDLNEQSVDYFKINGCSVFLLEYTKVSGEKFEKNFEKYTQKFKILKTMKSNSKETFARFLNEINPVIIEKIKTNPKISLYPGGCSQISTLILRIMRDLGINAYLVIKVNDGKFFKPSEFDHYHSYILLDIEGIEYIVDYTTNQFTIPNEGIEEIKDEKGVLERKVKEGFDDTPYDVIPVIIPIDKPINCKGQNTYGLSEEVTQMNSKYLQQDVSDENLKYLNMYDFYTGIKNTLMKLEEKNKCTPDCSTIKKAGKKVGKIVADPLGIQTTPCCVCIDDYSLQEKDDCWNQEDALCVENKCVKFEEMGWNEDVLENVKKLKNDQDPSVRVVAVYVLGEIKSPEAVPALIKALETDASEGVRRGAAATLGKIKSEQAVPALIKALETDASEGVRREVVLTLGYIPSEQAVPALIKALETDASEGVRGSVAFALGYIPSEQAVPALIKALETDSSEGVRREVVLTLGYIKSEQAITALMKALETDVDNEVKIAAIYALGKVESDDIVSLFKKILKNDKSEVVKKEIISRLGIMKRDTLPILLELLEELKNTNENERTVVNILDAVKNKIRIKVIKQEDSKILLITLLDYYKLEQNNDAKKILIESIFLLNQNYNINDFYSLTYPVVFPNYGEVLNFVYDSYDVSPSSTKSLFKFYIEGRGYFNVRNDCKESNSECIEINFDNGFIVKITSSENNIIVRNYGGIKSLFVEKIQYNTVALIDDDLIKVTISKQSGTILGDKSKLKTDIRYTIDNSILSCYEYCIEEKLESKIGYDVMSRVKSLSESELNIIKGNIISKYGVTPKRWFGLINSIDEIGYIEPFFKASEYVSENSYGIEVTPSYLYTIGVGEGLYLFFDQHRSPNGQIDGFSSLGVDTFGTAADSLKQEGFLEPNFNDYQISAATNEFKEEVKSATFPNLEAGLKALGAMLAQRQRIFLDDAKKVGLTKASFNEDELNFWTYAYFNNPCFSRGHLLNKAGNTFVCKVGTTTKTYTSEGREFFRKWVGAELSDIKSVRYNALLRTATWKWIEDTHIFDVGTELAKK